jgi:anion transporter
MIVHHKATTVYAQPKEQRASNGKSIWSLRTLCLVALSALLVWGVWFELGELSVHTRVALITFGLAVLGWILTDINDTYIALVAAIIFTVSGINHPEAFFETLGDSTIWLLLASFIVAAAVTASGLSRRLAVSVVTRARSVSQLFYLLTGVLMITAFIVPSTSGRAALMLPVFLAISNAISNKRITRALAILFPTVILLSAVASLIGAGAHLVTVEVVRRMGGETIGFSRWLILGLPFALVSSYLSTMVILRLFLKKDERTQPLQLTVDKLNATNTKQPVVVSGSFSRTEWYVLAIALGMIGMWMTESIHGVHHTMVALAGALLVTIPHIGAVEFKDAFKHVEWSMLVFMAATLAMGEALVESGSAEWLVSVFFSTLQGSYSADTPVMVGGVIMISLLAHLLITSRTARSSVLVPMVVLLGVSLGYNPTALAFISTAAAGFCLTMQVSAKPLTLFAKADGPTYNSRDLFALSGVLMPVHFLLLLVFALHIWPLMGLAPTRVVPTEQPTAPSRYHLSLDWLKNFPSNGSGLMEDLRQRGNALYDSSREDQAVSEEHTSWIERQGATLIDWISGKPESIVPAKPVAPWMGGDVQPTARAKPIATPTTAPALPALPAPASGN